MSALRKVLLWGSQNKWIERQFRRRRFAKKAVSRFMPGEDPQAALDAAARLAQRGVTTILTYLGENVASPAEAAAVSTHYRKLLDDIRTRGLDTHVSVKLTHLGLDLDREEAYTNLVDIVTHASNNDNFIWVDMEASEYVDPTLEIYHRARAAHPNVGVCVQAYLYRTERDVEELLKLDATIRLVKGAYNEPPHVAFPHKRDVDANFLKLTKRLLEHSSGSAAQPPALATHDMTLIEQACDAARRMGVPEKGFEVDMLYGIRAPEQVRLVDEGVPVRVLVSYGEAWFPWYMRRLAERPANVGFVFRSMVGV